MKFSWPWRRSKLLSLFDHPVEGSPKQSAAGRSLSSACTTLTPLRPHPKNAPGGFYVEDTECMSCGVPHAFAPELMDWDTDPEGRPSHCFFRKQPETALELIHAVRAVEGSCCGALRYGGTDAEIIDKLRAARCGDAIDRR